MTKKLATNGTLSGASQDDSKEHDPVSPVDNHGVAAKVVGEMKGEDGVWAKAKAAGRELDRVVGGEYEKREDPSGSEKP